MESKLADFEEPDEDEGEGEVEKAEGGDLLLFYSKASQRSR